MECIGTIQRGKQYELGLSAAVHFYLLLLPVNEPIFLYATARIELQFYLAVALLIYRARRDHFNNEFRRSMELAIFSQRSRQVVMTYPHDIRRHIIIFGKDHAGSPVGDS